MTKGQLKKLWVNVDDNAEIIIQKDAEGNEFSPLAEIYEGGYEPENLWSGEVDVEGEGCLVLAPVN